MIKAIIGALAGVAIISLGIYVWYVYVTTLERGGNHFLFVLSIVQIGIGLYVLFWASKNSDPLRLHKKNGNEKNGDMLDRNEKIRNEWLATNIDDKFIKVNPK